MDESADITLIKGVGPELARKLRALDITSVGDLVYYFPRKYIDYSAITPIIKLRPGIVSVQARINQVSGRYVRGGLHITEALVSDNSGSLKIVWFNQPYRAASISKGEEYYISGSYELKRSRLALLNPSIERVTDFPVNTARIVPVYRESKGVTSVMLRKLLREIFTQSITLPETLPDHVLANESLLPRAKALFFKHFPSSIEDVHKADERLGFEELFELILASQAAKRQLESSTAPTIEIDVKSAQTFVKALPFNLTEAQRKVVWKIYKDLEQSKPMNRLLEGDVGSGKTVVAAMAALAVMNNNYQVALMAPTELLARQHAETIYELMKPLKYESEVTLLLGSMTDSIKQKARSSIKQGKSRFVIGTHALVQQKVEFDKLALVVVDEQHRFGVDQRKKLLAKSGHAPHMLSMTATPIPRSLALTVFGEMDISILDEKPKGRQTIITKLIKPTGQKKLFKHIKSNLEHGGQMFVVCPLIQESDKILSSLSAEKTYSEIAEEFKDFSVGLLHGKQKADEKQQAMEDFVRKKLDILVSTTVIEVGVDVPNAHIMLIKGPERFGLAQLHQLRGRVGRGEIAGECYLLLSDNQTPSARLRAIETTQDGFKLAELDLQLRGAGALYGNYQHGQLDLRIANFTDVKLISRARSAALEFIKDERNLIEYPYIANRIKDLQTIVHLN